ncbi:cupin domain-containing protein [Kitasatospora acidiphila]|nr:cupin domain-containing protein [Kitasatospora acidiphila]
MRVADVANGAEPFELARLLHPVDLADFRQEYWERKPLLVQREDRDYYAELMTLAEYDRMLSLAGGNLEHLRVVQDGKETPVSELGSGSSETALESVYARYRDGATIVMNSIQARFASMNRLTRSLGSEIGARIQVNSYLTPATSRGFAPHYDTHDVFIVQVYGSKRWQLFESPLALPLRSQPFDRSQAEPALAQEFELRAGDVLYLPRGTVHAGTATGEASLHLTVGVHPILWANVLAEAMQQLVETDVRYRAGLPMGFTNSAEIQRRLRETVAELAAELPSKLALDDAVARTITRGVAINAPVLQGHLLDLERVDEVSLETKLRRRPDLQWRLTVDEETVHLSFHGKTVRLPAHVADEVRYAAHESGAPLTAAAIPGELDEPGRLVLVRKLLSEGFLTFA